jgi:hypothetical protein
MKTTNNLRGTYDPAAVAAAVREQMGDRIRATAIPFVAVLNDADKVVWFGRVGGLFYVDVAAAAFAAKQRRVVVAFNHTGPSATPWPAERATVVQLAAALARRGVALVDVLVVAAADLTCFRETYASDLATTMEPWPAPPPTPSPSAAPAETCECDGAPVAFRLTLTTADGTVIDTVECCRDCARDNAERVGLEMGDR